MPHLILEHSAELSDTHDIGAVVNDLFETAANSGLFGRQDIRARSVACDNTVSGAAKPGFAHVTLRLLDGRPDAAKKEITEALLDVLLKHMPEVGALSVAPEDILRNTYARRVIHKGNDNG